MRKTLFYALGLLLSFALVFQPVAQAEASASATNTTIEVVNGNTLTTTTTKQGDLTTLSLEVGDSTTTAVYNKETDEAYLDGNKISEEQLDFIKMLGNSLKNSDSSTITAKDLDMQSVLTPIEDLDIDSEITPFQVVPDPIGGGSWTWEKTTTGSVNLAGLTVGGIALIIAGIFSSGATIPAIAGAAGLLASFVTNDTYVFYYEKKTWSKPDPKYAVILKLYWDEVKFYTSSNRKTGLVHTMNIYR